MTAKDSQNITRPEMRDALLRSGYLLEARVETVLRDRWGYVEANPRYPDPNTGVSREYDAFALKAYPTAPGNTREHDYLFGNLIVECINNPQPLVVLTKPPLTGYLIHDEIKAAGVPAQLIVSERDDSERWQCLSEFLGVSEYHHYWTDRVGTQFCSFSKKGKSQRDKSSEWMAFHDDSHFDAFKKLCQITDHHSEDRVQGEGRPPIRVTVNLEIYYPLIVVQGDLVEAQETKRSVRLRSSDHLQFRHSIARGFGSCEYRIDIIRERYLGRYLDAVESELEKTAALIRKNYPTVERTIDTLASRIERGEAEENWRSRLRHSHVIE